MLLFPQMNHHFIHTAVCTKHLWVQLHKRRVIGQLSDQVKTFKHIINVLFLLAAYLYFLQKNYTMIHSFLEIGSGWISAMVTSENEYNLLVEHQNRFEQNQKYWIGGSTRAKGNIMFSYYLPYEKGAGEMGINICVLIPLQIQTVFNNT